MSQTLEQRFTQVFLMLENAVSDLKKEVIGNPEFGNPGIVGQIKSLKQEIDYTNAELKDVRKQISDIDKDNFKTRAKIAGASAGIGAAAAILGKAILTKAASLFPFIKP